MRSPSLGPHVTSEPVTIRLPDLHQVDQAPGRSSASREVMREANVILRISLLAVVAVATLYGSTFLEPVRQRVVSLFGGENSEVQVAASRHAVERELPVLPIEPITIAPPAYSSVDAARVAMKPDMDGHGSDRSR